MDENDKNNGAAAEQPTQDDKEWGQAFDEFSANKGLDPGEPGDKKKEGDDAAADANKGTAEGNKPDAGTGSDADKDKKTEGIEDGTDKPKGDEEDVTAPIREQRAIQRELAEDRKQTIADVKEKMFSDLKTELTDSDGDPIRTPEDVMKLMNPNTKKPFTYEEAASYLLQAQKHLNVENEKAQAQIEEIAEVNIALKDESDAVRTRWGKLLAARPDLKKETWEDYKATLVVDPKSGVITKSPVSMERFYNRALAGYESSAQQIETANKEKQDAEARATRAQSKTDRTDITSGGKSDTADPEDKEWGAAFKQHYEGK